MNMYEFQAEMRSLETQFVIEELKRKNRGFDQIKEMEKAAGEEKVSVKITKSVTLDGSYTVIGNGIQEFRPVSLEPKTAYSSVSIKL